MSGPADQDEENRRLREQYTEIAHLAGGLAHEIKNPLSTLSLNLQLLAEDFAHSDAQEHRRAQQKIKTLQRECQRLEEILNDFLRFARVSELHSEEADLNCVVEEMVDFHAPQAQAAGVVLRTDLPASLPKVALDVDMFKQALLNLLLNANHAMPSGGELILKTHANDKSVFLDVIDTGPGISAEMMEKIYRPFYSNRPGGSGLGLPTTKKIIEAHGGTLHAESEPGKGTKFTIELPRSDRS